MTHTNSTVRAATRALMATLALATAGCGTSLRSEPVIDALPAADLRASSAVAVFALSDARTITEYLLLPELEPSFAGPCPSRTVEGATTVYRGGCTHERTRYEGTVRITRATIDGVETASVAYDHWSATATRACRDGGSLEERNARDGTITARITGARRELSADIVMDTATADTERCAASSDSIALLYDSALAYSGEDRDGNGRGDVVRANGAGRVGLRSLGRVESTTRDLVYDSARCGEPLSGTLELRAGQRALITYDGASRCGHGETRTAPLEIDGVARGEVTVVACSVGRSVGASQTSVIALFAMGAVAMARRTRARRTRAQTARETAE